MNAGQCRVTEPRAIALDPNDAEGYATLAHILSLAGRPEEAIGMVQKALRLNPYYPAEYLTELGRAYYVAGRHAEAMAALKRALIRNPDFLPTHAYLAAIYSELGREDEAEWARILLARADDPGGRFKGRWERVAAKVLPGGRLQWVNDALKLTLTFEMAQDRMSIHGDMNAAGRAVRVIMKRVEP